MKLSVAPVQLDASEDVAANLEAAVALADEAATGARLVALPETRNTAGRTQGSAGPHGRSPVRTRIR